jgi:MoaA/NifB/PqqE/SkfB family radical SAM enzyme
MTDFKIISGNRARLMDRLPLPKPLSLFIEPTNICNFRCVMCVHGSENTRNDLKPFMDIDMALYGRIIRELQEWDGPRLKLLRLTILGEPLLNKNIVDMIKIAKQCDVAECVDLFTNASVLTPDLAEQLVDSGLDRIRFSIYAVDEERHAKVTAQKRFTPKAIHGNIKRLREIRDAKHVQTPYMLIKMFDAYGPENDMFFSMYRDIADEIDLEKVHNATRYTNNDLVNKFYDNTECAKRTNDAYFTNLHELKACPRPFMALCIDSLANVLMCTLDAPRYTKIANLNDITLRDVWFGNTLFEFRKMQLEGRLHENKMCARCDWFKLFPQEDNVDGFSVEKLKMDVNNYLSLHKLKDIGS